MRLVVQRNKHLYHIRKLDESIYTIIPFGRVFSAVELAENVVDDFSQRSIFFMTVNLRGFTSNIHFTFGFFDLVFFEGIFQLSQFAGHITVPSKSSPLSLMMKIFTRFLLTESLITTSITISGATS